MRSETSSRRGRFAASATAVLLLAGGVTTVGFGVQAPPLTPNGSDKVSIAAPHLEVEASGAVARPYPATDQEAPPSTLPPVDLPAQVTALPRSVPVRVEIPSIGVNSALLEVGKQANGEIETPPGEAGSPGGWYKHSPTPGQTGSAVILGHVNSNTSTEGLFYRLHELTPGQSITVIRADHTAAVFTVEKIDTYPKATFPTVEVYRNATRPEVRLITCGGYDRATGEYLENTVVYATLTSSHSS